MNPWVVLLGVGVLIAANWGLVGKRLLALQLSLGKINKVSLKLFNSYINCNINIKNPNQRNVTMQQMLLKVVINGVQVADIDYRKTISLKAADTTILQGFVIEIKNLQLATLVFNGGTDVLRINISGKVKADGMWFPYDETSIVNISSVNIT